MAIPFIDYEMTDSVYNGVAPMGEMGPWRLSSVIVTEEEYFRMVTTEINSPNPIEMGNILESKHIPMISRGDKTEGIFRRYGSENRYMCIMVRGYGPLIASALFGNSKKPMACA